MYTNSIQLVHTVSSAMLNRSEMLSHLYLF